MTIISLEALSRFFATPKTEALPLPVVSVDARLAEYNRLLRIYRANTRGGSEVDFNECMFAGPTGVMREDWVTLYEE